MTVAISAINIRTKFDYRYVNRLIECFGELATDRDFLLIGRKEQADLLIPAPKNFEYRFYKHLPISEPDSPLIDNLFDNILTDFGCDLLLEFGLGGAFNIKCPRISLINSFEMCGPSNKSGKTSFSGKKLKLINRAAVKNIKKNQGIIFSSHYLQNEISRNMPITDLKTTSIYIEKPDTAGSNNRQVLSEYGVNSRFLLSLVSSECMQEFSRMLMAYCFAFEQNPDAPDLILAGTNESPADASEILNAIGRMPLKSKIKYIGTIPEEDFLALLDEARILVFSSETFNIAEILVAAMNRGCAIVCTNEKIPREITDGAALYFNPGNWRDLGFKLRLIIDDKALSNFLKCQSKEKANLFSWEKTTKQMLEFFDDVTTDYKNENASTVSKDTITY